MYASVAAEVPRGDRWAFEPKYDGIRVLAFATGRGAALVTRNGKAKTAQFPEIAEALGGLARRTRRDLVLDGEIVAMKEGAPERFQQLQARMHVQDPGAIARLAADAPAAFIAFDLLVDGARVLLDEPWTNRRSLLERRLAGVRGAIALGESVRDDADALLERARREGWEGLIAKRMDAQYRPGIRTRDWLKLKLEHRQEFVVGGWTEPRRSRPWIGALLLGYFDGDRLEYAGHMGGGFTQAQLKEMYARLSRIERRTPPFAVPPRTNEPAHWVRPDVVVEVRFNEWTADGKLRQPIFLGVRDDKEARQVTREAMSVQRRAATAATAVASRGTSRARSPGSREPSRAASPAAKSGREAVMSQLRRIQREGGEGEVRFENGSTLRVSSLGKVFFPEAGFTKGDLMRYYARVAPLLLPLIKDRPLALRRFPDGVGGSSFYQQNAGEHVPAEVRTATVEDATGRREPRFIGGDLLTLLYTVQIGSIDVHPWHSRLRTLDAPDYTLLDLDPGEGVRFAQVIELARLVKRELDEAGLVGALKTSGSRGLHIAIPLPPRLTFRLALDVAHEIARRVAERAPSLATLERRLKSRPRGTIYVDYQQNARGKTIACAYAVRARTGATVSMPVPWSALRATLDPARFTIATVPARAARTRTAWQGVMRKSNSVRTLRTLTE